MTIEIINLNEKVEEKVVDTDDFYDDATALFENASKKTQNRSSYVIYMNDIEELRKY